MDDTTMSEKRGGVITEEDLSAVSQRYTTTTVLTLLQEVGQVQELKIDWYAMVNHTKTGITNPREYQMLWRHLAYREPLTEKFEDDLKPLVLIASDPPSESSIEKGLVMEAPLMINIPKDKSTPSPSNHTQHANGVNITVPVFVPTQVIPQVLTAEALDTTNTCANSNFPSRRKRKPWSAEEDRELSEAVQRCGEGNWANLLKGDFKGDRTPSQLSQRWNTIKKRQTNSNVKAVPQLSEAQLAARRALNMALDKPGIDNTKNISYLGGGHKPVHPTMADPPPPAATFRQNQTQPDPKRPFLKPNPFPRPPPKLLGSGPDAVKAAAVAAGARIATQSAAAVILKAQLKTASAIHIKTHGNGTTTGRPPVAPMGGRISPHGPPRSNLTLAHGHDHGQPSGGPVVHLGQTTGPKGGGQGQPVKDEQVVVSENLKMLNLESGAKDEEEKVCLA